MSIVTLAVFLLVSSFLFPSGASGAIAYVDQGDVEVGLVLGEPTGFSAKFWTTANTAFDIGLAWSFGDGGHFHIHADYLFHNFDFFEVDSGNLPLYFGIGGRARIQDEDSRIGLRVAVGIEYILESHPFSFFFEIAPVVDFAPETDADINGGIGVRYIF
jgi:hypothetical protein